MSTLKLNLRLPAAPEAPGMARRALEGLALSLGDETCHTIQLLVTELVTNSIRHSGRPAGQIIEVAVTSTQDAIRVAVVDTGPGFTRPEAPPVPGITADSGWGLFLTDRLSRRWGVTDEGGTQVWFELPRGNGDRGIQGDVEHDVSSRNR